MIDFLIATAVIFGLCWVWVGGYLADLFIWIISKVTPDSSNEKTLAYVVAGVFLTLGIIVFVATMRQTYSGYYGGAIAGLGIYIAVRLPNKIRLKREKKLNKAGAQNSSLQQPASAAPAPAIPVTTIPVSAAPVTPAPATAAPVTIPTTATIPANMQAKQYSFSPNQSPETQTVNQSGGNKYCRSCGVQHKTTDRFCPACGSQV